MIANLKESEQHQHKNGGGWVADTASVADSVYVDKHALVYGQAEVTDNVRILDVAQVSGHAKLSGDVVVSRHAWVDGNTKATTGHFYKNERAQATKQERIR
jgi:acyl-[acyl carrier protein]--UDP-N-acetylglucosamine O-acyltransferase